MLSNPYAQAGLHPYSSLYAQANQDVEKGKHNRKRTNQY